jgi:hypothetical protein
MIPRESIEAVLDYLEEDEAADFQAQHWEDGDPAGTHVYTHIRRVREWLGPILTVTVPRDDFALLMDAIALCEQGQKLSIDDGMVTELSRIASDLSQQVDGQ